VVRGPVAQHGWSIRLIKELREIQTTDLKDLKPRETSRRDEVIQRIDGNYISVCNERPRGKGDHWSEPWKKDQKGSYSHKNIQRRSARSIQIWGRESVLTPVDTERSRVQISPGPPQFHNKSSIRIVCVFAQQRTLNIRFFSTQ
jgi:hypothetical protein